MTDDHQGYRLISAIVPVDLARRPVGLLARLNRMLGHIDANSPNYVIAHNDRDTVFDHALKRICAWRRVQLISDSFYGGAVNNALLRNAAMRKIDTPLSVLVDADLYLPPALLGKMRETAIRKEKHFQVFPCLYLSRRGSKELIGRRATPQALFQDYLQFKRAAFLHLAVASSVLLFRTGDFDRAGGFDSRFVGHGYEDLDFMLRLAWLHGEIAKSESLLEDFATRAPLLGSGFRAHLTRLGLPALLDGDVAFHLWHPTRKDSYYEARNSNAELFRRKLDTEILSSRHEDSASKANGWDLDLIREWCAMCEERNIDVRRYSILFDNRPGHVDRVDAPLRRLKSLFGSI